MNAKNETFRAKTALWLFSQPTGAQKMREEIVQNDGFCFACALYEAQSSEILCVEVTNGQETEPAGI